MLLLLAVVAMRVGDMGQYTQEGNYRYSCRTNTFTSSLLALSDERFILEYSHDLLRFVFVSLEMLYVLVLFLPSFEC